MFGAGSSGPSPESRGAPFVASASPRRCAQAFLATRWSLSCVWPHPDQTITPTLGDPGRPAVGAVTYWAGRHARPARALVRFLVVASPLVAYWVLRHRVGWDDWGGFMLNLFLTFAGIPFAFPFGCFWPWAGAHLFPWSGPSRRLHRVDPGCALITLLLLGSSPLAFSSRAIFAPRTSPEC